MSTIPKKFSLIVRTLPIKYPQIADLQTILHSKTPSRIIPQSERDLISRIDNRIIESSYSTVSELYVHLRELGLNITPTPFSPRPY